MAPKLPSPDHTARSNNEEAAPDAAGGANVDLSATYVLDETAITMTMSIEELAELALHKDEEAREDEATRAGSEHDEPRDDAFDWDELK